MNLSHSNNLIVICPVLDKPLTLTDEVDLIRITIDPECIPKDVLHELLAMLAEDFSLPHFGKWEDSVEFAVCFMEEGEEWQPVMEASTANGEAVYLDIDAKPEELAKLYLPLFNAGNFDEESRNSLAGVMEGLRFSNYQEMITRTAGALVCLAYVMAIQNNPTLSVLPGFDNVLELSVNRRVPMVADLFVDFCNAVKIAAKV